MLQLVEKTWKKNVKKKSQNLEINSQKKTKNKNKNTDVPLGVLIARYSMKKKMLITPYTLHIIVNAESPPFNIHPNVCYKKKKRDLLLLDITHVIHT